MKILIKFTFYLLLVTSFFTACEKEDIDEIVPRDPAYQPEVVDVNTMVYSLRPSISNMLELDCITIPLPIDLLQQSGNTVTIFTTEELEEAAMLADSIVDFVYPFSAEYESETLIIESVEDLAIALINCGVITGTDCTEDQDAHVLLFYNALNIFTINRYIYTINYPVSLIVEGTEVVLNNDDDYLPAIGGDPFSPLPTELSYPITITQFGRDIVLDNDSEVCGFYATLDEDCENKPAHIQFFFNDAPGTRVSCAYYINYPFEVVLNGNTLVIDSRETYLNELNTSSDAYTNMELVYPVTAAKVDNGDQLTFEDADNICEYLLECQ